MVATLEELLRLTELKATDRIRAVLSAEPSNTKGALFERYLVALYKGNGWLARQVGGRDDAGADILLSHPDTPNVISFIVQAKNQHRPLKKDDVVLELRKFEERGSKKHHCDQFMLVSMSGIVSTAAVLSEFNLLIKDWSYVCEELIATYDRDGENAPKFQLFAHNEIAYQCVCDSFSQSRAVAAVQATGTGKSFLIAKLFSDNVAKRKLFVAPSTYIIEQQQRRCPWVNESTNYITYAKLANLNDDEITGLSPELIVLDEFHRAGADHWGRGTKKLLEIHAESLVFGTTATPVRHLDGRRDMSDELFDGHVAHSLTLAEAIETRVLPMPVYVTSLYTLSEEAARLRVKIQESERSDVEKEELSEQLTEGAIAWDRASGPSEILRKYLPPNTSKLVVFCRDREHLDEMQWVVLGWLQKAGIGRNRKTFTVASDMPNSAQELQNFQLQNDKGTFSLLFCIDMLNEGVHMEDVGGVVLLRKTVSPRVFYQQIGRCLNAGGNETPVVFDFVNNFASIRANDFLQDLQDAKDSQTEKRAAFGLPDHSPAFTVVDETKDVLSLFNEIEDRLTQWELMFERLQAYVNAHGHAAVSGTQPTLLDLHNWVRRQRTNRVDGMLSESRIQRLDSIGFVWNTNEDRWWTRYQELKSFQDEFGHCRVPTRWPQNEKLAYWVVSQRRFRREQRLILTNERIELLDAIGFSWETGDDVFENWCTQLIEYRETFGVANVSQINPEYRELGRWINTMREYRKRGQLSDEQLQRLNDIGFVWDPREERWDQRLAELREFHDEYGHINVPTDYQHAPKLHSWLGKLKRKRPSRERQEKLIANGILIEWADYSEAKRSDSSPNH